LPVQKKTIVFRSPRKENNKI